VEAAESFDINNDRFFGKKVHAEIAILHFFFPIRFAFHLYRFSAPTFIFW
jgi:hypothetical protein